MFPLGVLGLIQMAVLPGYIWMRATLVKTSNRYEELVYPFAASLILNHWLVYFLAALGLNHRPAWLTIVIAEAVLVVLLRHRDRAAVDAIAQAEPPDGQKSWTASVWTALALVNIAAFAFLLLQNWGTVFISNDAVASWDRWAQDWFLNRFPVGPGLYPQLLPANWSITYALMSTPEVKMFAKAIMPAFGLGVLLLFASLAERRRDPAFLAGCSTCGYLFLQGLGPDFLMSGDVDVALAFLSFLAFYTLYRNGPRASAEFRWLSLFFAAGAALAKQGGLLVLAAVVVYLAIQRRPSEQEGGRPAPALRLSALLNLAFVALWYTPRFYEAATRGSNLGFLLQDLHQGRGFLARIEFASNLFIDALGPHGTILFVILAVLTLGALLCAPARKIAMGIVLPGFLLWGVSFSYELRTGAPLFPFIALVCGIVIGRAEQLFIGKLGLPWRFRGAGTYGAIGILLLMSGVLLRRPANAASHSDVYAWPMILVGAGSMVAGMVRFQTQLRTKLAAPLIEIAALAIVGLALWPLHPAGSLLTEQLDAQRLMGNPAVNAQLYRLLKAGQLDKPVLSDYWYLASLPGMRSLIRTLDCGQCSLPSLLGQITSNKDAGFLLLQGGFLPSNTMRSIEHCPGLNPAFTEGSVTLFRIDRARFHGDCPVDLAAIRPVIQKMYPSETAAGKGFNVQPDGNSAISIACRNGTPSSAIVWAGTVLDSAYGGPNSVTAEVPARLFGKPGHYAIEIWDKDSGLKSAPADFEVK
jgi:hypothetical protein